MNFVLSKNLKIFRKLTPTKIAAPPIIATAVATTFYYNTTKTFNLQPLIQDEKMACFDLVLR